MRHRFTLRRDTRGSAAAEMALVAPLLLIIMFGSMEMGNFMLTQHALAKQTRDGARFGSRLEFEDVSYSCPGDVWKATDPEEQIINVVKTGTVDGTGDGRFNEPVWADANRCDDATDTVTVTVRCVDQADSELNGMYTGLSGEIPVVQVSAAVQYQPLLAPVGISLGGRCMRAESEMPVTGL